MFLIAVGTPVEAKCKREGIAGWTIVGGAVVRSSFLDASVGQTILPPSDHI